MKSISGRIAVILGLVLVWAFPAESQEGNDKLLQELFLKSGINQLTEQLPVIFQGGVDQGFAQDQNLKKLSGDVLQEIKDAAASAYASQKMRNIMLKFMAGRLSDAEVKSVIQWLDSPLGIKTTDLEKKSLAPGWLDEMARFAEEIHKRPPPAERLKLIGELDRATQATAASVEMFINTYIDFANSPAGSKFNTVSIAAFQQAMVEGGVDFGQAVANVYENMGKKKAI